MDQIPYRFVSKDDSLVRSDGVTRPETRLERGVRMSMGREPMSRMFRGIGALLAGRGRAWVTGAMIPVAGLSLLAMPSASMFSSLRATSAIAAGSPAAVQEEPAVEPGVQGRAELESLVVTGDFPKFYVSSLGGGQFIPSPDGGSDGGGDTNPRACDNVSTHTDAAFDGGSYVVQAGFAETEIAAASYTIPSGSWPIQIVTSEVIVAQQNTISMTTTKWTMLFWSGKPNTGTLVASYSSDGDILPHIVLPQGTQGTNLLFGIDPGDPEQIIINAPSDGSNTFSIGFRIDDHNAQTGQWLWRQQRHSQQPQRVSGDGRFGSCPACEQLAARRELRCVRLSAQRWMDDVPGPEPALSSFGRLGHACIVEAGELPAGRWRMLPPERNMPDADGRELSLAGRAVQGRWNCVQCRDLPRADRCVLLQQQLLPHAVRGRLPGRERNVAWRWNVVHGQSVPDGRMLPPAWHLREHDAGLVPVAGRYVPGRRHIVQFDQLPAADGCMLPEQRLLPPAHRDGMQRHSRCGVLRPADDVRGRQR
jgi:hypothetical protein